MANIFIAVSLNLYGSESPYKYSDSEHQVVGQTLERSKDSDIL